METGEIPEKLDKKYKFQYPLVDWGDGDTPKASMTAVKSAYFSILWWIGVMETLPYYIGRFRRPIFQYPLVDWGDGDSNGLYTFRRCNNFSILWWIGVMETLNHL